MINEYYAKSFCRDDISKIENYEAAMADTTQTWHCHHRNELTINGEFAHTKADLIRMDMYYNRPYFELIFLTPHEHHHMHHAGKKLSDESRKKISDALKGKEKHLCEGKLSIEHRKKLNYSNEVTIEMNNFLDTEVSVDVNAKSKHCLTPSEFKQIYNAAKVKGILKQTTLAQLKNHLSELGCICSYKTHGRRCIKNLVAKESD